MCGLAMVVTKSKYGFNLQLQNVFSSLLYLSGGYRGRDGAGVVVVDNIGNVQLAKAGCSVDAFLNSDEFGALDKKAFQNGWAMFGHNRAATRGEVSDENSHPFVVDDKIVLMHNGTFSGDHKKIKDTKVDSEVIAHILAEEDNVELALRKVDAAFALMWYNVDKRQLHIIRNAQRPLWYMETSDAHIYASEEGFLQFVKHRYKLTTTKNPFEIQHNYLTTFTMDDEGDVKVECVEKDISFWKHKEKGGAVVTGPFQQGANEEWRGYQSWYGMEEDDDEVVLLPAPVVAPTPSVVINTREYNIRLNIARALRGFITPITNAKWSLLVDSYKQGQTVKVLVNDMLEADDHPRTNNWILMGTTLDANKLHVALPISNKTLEEVIDCSNDAVFEAEVGCLTWQRVDDFHCEEKTDIKGWDGLVLLHGVNAKPVLVNKQHAC